MFCCDPAMKFQNALISLLQSKMSQTLKTSSAKPLPVSFENVTFWCYYRELNDIR